jgi:hypothetical protein
MNAVKIKIAGVIVSGIAAILAAVTVSYRKGSAKAVGRCHFRPHDPSEYTCAGYNIADS